MNEKHEAHIRTIDHQIDVMWLHKNKINYQDSDFIRKLIDRLPFSHGFIGYSVLVYKNNTIRLSINHMYNHTYFKFNRHHGKYFTKGIFANRGMGTRLKRLDRVYFNMIFYKILNEINSDYIDF